MILENTKIKALLLEGSYVSEEDMKRAETHAKERHGALSESLFSLGLLTKDLMGQAMAESFGVPYADLNSNQPPKEQVLRIPEATAKKFNVVVFREESRKILITTDNPKQEGLSEALQTIFVGKRVAIAFSLSEDITVAFTHYRKTLETRFQKIIKEEGRVAPQILDEIIADALLLNTSDIHIEPRVGEVLVRFRVDGVMQEAGRIPKIFYDNILNRIKVQAHLRTDEHFSAQDGAIRYEQGEHSADIRVSIIPIMDGEKVVMRILSKYVQGFTLSDLGLSPKDEALLREASQKPFGMILVTGPTGSGKTTTLYSLIRILNRPDINIATIEDPVEYKVEGVNQIQVNADTNLTFAQGLKSIVRQDPDTILVGEIRDNETVEIAVNAALTGHLLFSTFHANDSATAIPRLLDMKIEPFLLASTMELILAQRLVRRICESCRYSYIEGEETLYKGKGCESCNHTGYKGRIGIFECIAVTSKIRECILEHPSSQQIWKIARAEGSGTLYEDGLEKVKSGITTLEELKRVASEK